MDKHAHRKDEHVFIAEKQYQINATNGLEQVRLLPQTLPEIALNEIDISTTFLGQKVEAPFFINAMTGGSPETDKLNFKLAKVAKETGLPLAVGSQSIALRFPEAEAGFKKMRQLAGPKTLLLSNLGAEHSFENCLRALEMLEADALELHVNVAQELTMPEGDRSFYALDNIKEVQAKLSQPLLVKEVGGGISPLALPKLKAAGVKYLDLSGKGGTNFITIENERRKEKDHMFLAGFGLTTAETLLGAKPYHADFSLTASGGIRSALDIAKCLALGADNVGISGEFLHILLKEDVGGLIKRIENLKAELKSVMALVGCRSISQLQQAPHLLSPELLSFEAQLKKYY